MKDAVEPGYPFLLTLNAGSATLKFSLFEISEHPAKIWSGAFEKSGESRLVRRLEDLKLRTTSEGETTATSARDQVREIASLIEERWPGSKLSAIGQRVVHGGLHRPDHVLLSEAILTDLRDALVFDPEHLPAALEAIETVAELFPHVPQALCFDTVFHHDLPEAARTLPIPRRLTEKGLRRFGFHGLSYSYLLGELRRQAGDAAADGRVILAHLGSGASMAAVREGRCVDTTMALTSTAGLVMGTRTGDLDPGLAAYLETAEGMTAGAFSRMASHESGLLGMSGRSGDMRALLGAEASDPASANALAVFVHQARKWIGALAATLGGLDTLVFSGGIGEHSAEIRARLCAGLEFLGVLVDEEANLRHATVISPRDGSVTVRVIPTDEEQFIAETTLELIPRKPTP